MNQEQAKRQDINVRLLIMELLHCDLEKDITLVVRNTNPDDDSVSVIEHVAGNETITVQNQPDSVHIVGSYKPKE